MVWVHWGTSQTHHHRTIQSLYTFLTNLILPFSLVKIIDQWDYNIAINAKVVSLIFICWIVIYPVDSAIQHLNYWGQGLQILVIKLFSIVNINVPLFTLILVIKHLFYLSTKMLPICYLLVIVLFQKISALRPRMLFWFECPHPSGNSSLVSYLSLKNFGL